MSDERERLEALFYLYARLNVAADARVMVEFQPTDELWTAGVYSKGRYLAQLVARQVSGQWKIWPSVPMRRAQGC